MPSPLVQTRQYGTHEVQSGDLYVPAEPRRVICLLHGGFWRMPYGREGLSPLAEHLFQSGFAVWNIEYRRGGEGGWPATFLDVIAAIEYLAHLVDKGLNLPLDNVVVAGHSAGGHLALWSAARDRFPGAGAQRVRVMAVAGLGPVADLDGAYALSLGSNAVGDFLGGGPADVPERYEAASPHRLLPLGVKQLIVHGARDEVVPAALSCGYVQKARRASDPIDYLEPEDVGHAEFLDPGSPACRHFTDWLTHLD